MSQLVQKGECWTSKLRLIRGLGVQYLLGVTFYYWNFLFSCSKAFIGIITNFVCL